MAIQNKGTKKYLLMNWEV